MRIDQHNAELRNDSAGLHFVPGAAKISAKYVEIGLSLCHRYYLVRRTSNQWRRDRGGPKGNCAPPLNFGLLESCQKFFVKKLLSSNAKLTAKSFHFGEI